MARVATVLCFIGEHQACPREKYVKNHLIDHSLVDAYEPRM